MDIEEKKPVRSAKGGEDDVLEVEADIVQSQHPQTLEDEENEAGLEQDVPQKPTFSKTRLIALVITVTGAQFLNAGMPSTINRQNAKNCVDARNTSCCHCPPYHR